MKGIGQFLFYSTPWTGGIVLALAFHSNHSSVRFLRCLCRKVSGPDVGPPLLPPFTLDLLSKTKGYKNVGFPTHIKNLA